MFAEVIAKIVKNKDAGRAAILKEIDWLKTGPHSADMVVIFSWATA